VESEEPVQEHLVELFERVDPDCVLDVGANEGQYAQLLRAHGYRGWIVSFEPVEGPFAELSARADEDAHWRAFRLALGARSERRTIAVAEVTQLSSLRRLNRYAAVELPGATEVTHTEEIEVAALGERWEELLEGIPTRRPFLKLDTQGWDLEVLRGAEPIVERLAGIQLEASVTPIYEGAPTFTQTIEHVFALGFGLTGTFPVNRDSLLRLIELDCVFINPTHPDAEDWRQETWTMQLARLREEVAAAVPSGRSFALIDDGALGIDEIESRWAIPFPERDGEYTGAPEDGEQARAELSRQAASGVRHIVVAWPSFWWLEEYPEFQRELQSRWRSVFESDVALVFEREGKR